MMSIDAFHSSMSRRRSSLGRCCSVRCSPRAVAVARTARPRRQGERLGLAVDERHGDPTATARVRPGSAGRCRRRRRRTGSAGGGRCTAPTAPPRRRWSLPNLDPDPAQAKAQVDQHLAIAKHALAQPTPDAEGALRAAQRGAARSTRASVDAAAMVAFAYYHKKLLRHRRARARRSVQAPGREAERAGLLRLRPRLRPHEPARAERADRVQDGGRAQPELRERAGQPRRPPAAQQASTARRRRRSSG